MNASPAHDHRLSYRTPARYWTDALPIGNGRLGAMIFGDPDHDRWQFNDDTCWSGGPATADGTPAGDEPSPEVIARVRALLLAGEVESAEQEIRKVQYGHSQAYQPLADLTIDVDGPTATLVQRGLDLSTATAGWRTAESSSEVFASAPAGAIVGRYAWDTARNVVLQLTAAHAEYGHAEVTADDRGLLLTSRMPSDVHPGHDKRYADAVAFDLEPGRAITAVATVRVLSDGAVEPDGDALVVRQATWLRLTLTTETDFVDPQTPPHGDRARLIEAARTRAETVSDTDLAELRSDHVREYRSWFDRFDLELGRNAPSDQDTDDVLEQSRTGDIAPHLVADLVQYGRYLMISSSRPGSRAINLQGIWNPWVQPPWSSNYTVNINTEMNYWPATTSNLIECAEPLYDLVEAMAATGSRTAGRVYGRSGWAAHHNADIWGFSLPVGTGTANPCWAAWPMAGFWLLRHFVEHHQFTGDDDFLITRLWPLLDGAVAFGLDTMITLPDGSQGVAPSTSPENSYLTADGATAAITISSTMDIALLRDAFSCWLSAAGIVRAAGGSVNASREAAVAEARAGLPLPDPTERSTYPEWLADLPEAEPQHRHQSHLYDIHPGAAVTAVDAAADPGQADRLAAAAETLRLRGSYSTGWSLAWRLSLHARLRNPEAAVQSLQHFLSPVPDEIAAAGPAVAQAGGVYRNLFCAHPPFQIDGNFGATAGVIEMLIQSHGLIDGLRVVELLPCLPAGWPEGRLSGVRARGGLTVDLAWSDGEATTVRIVADHDQQFLLRVPGQDDRRIELVAGQEWLSATNDLLTKTP